MLFHYPLSKPWKCLFRTQLSPEEEYLLSPYLIRSLDELNNENCLVAMRPMSDGYLKYIEERLQRATGYEMMFGILDRLESRMPSDLVRFCKDKDCGAILFHGIAELYYFLQQLNNPGLNNLRLNNLRLINGNVASPVRVRLDPKFKSHSPQLLITYSYLAGQSDDCLVAASVTWCFIKVLPGTVRVKNHPAIRLA